MEGGNGIPGGMLPGSMGSGMLGLEMPLHHHQHRTHPQQQQLLPVPAQPHEVDHPPQQQQLRHAYAAYAGCGRGKQQPLTLSSEEEPGFGDEGGTADAAKRVSQSPSPSPWQRMKWTDSMVRLLIMVVYCVGDDAGGGTGTEGEQHQPPASVVVGKGKKAPTTASAGAAGLLLQKKGKWKSVSRAMIEKGFYVSPQQCEDKFNDLNKRYKRVNDLLGKGTACRVVENQALLDSMDHLSPKAKEEARKLLNSKHLFFREMCAYHNSGGGGGGAAASSSSCALPQPSQSQPLPDQSQQQQQHLCFHHPSDSSTRGQGEAAFVGKGGPGGSSRLEGVEELGMAEEDEDNNDDDDEDTDNDEEEEDDYDDDEDDDNEDIEHHHHHRQQQKHEEGGYEDEDSKEFMATTMTCSGAKRARRGSMLLSTPSLSASPPLSLALSSSPATKSTSMQQLRCELMGSLATVGGEQQQRQWLRRKAAELEEQRMGYQCRALELERQRFKWFRFSSSKEREMERMKLHNERLRLQNDRMLLLLRQKEQELVDASGASSTPIQFAVDHFHHRKL